MRRAEYCIGQEVRRFAMEGYRNAIQSVDLKRFRYDQNGNGRVERRMEMEKK